MTLGQLIGALKTVKDKSRTMSKGFRNPHSWRSMYQELAFEPAENVTVLEMLQAAEGAVNKTFQGYKGGDFTMTLETPIHISHEGESYDYLAEYTLYYLFGEPTTVACEQCWERFVPPAANHSRVKCLEVQLARAKEEEARRQERQA